MKKLFLVLAAALPFLFTSCKETKVLEGNWKTIALTQNGKEYKVVDSFIEIENAIGGVIVHGNSGVNLFNGDIKIKKGKIISEGQGFASTRMMGPEEDMIFEDRFLEILSYADTYTVEEDILTIKSSSKEGEIKFQKQ